MTYKRLQEIIKEIAETLGSGVKNFTTENLKTYECKN